MIIKKIIENSGEDLIIRIKLVPNSSKNDIFYEENLLKVKIMAPPIENKANKALVEFLSKKFKLAKSNIQIIKGEKSKEKTILLKNFDQQTVTKILTVLMG